MPFPPASFDAALMQPVLNFVDDPDASVAATGAAHGHPRAAAATGRKPGGSVHADVVAFNACIRQSPFLTITKLRADGSLIEKIRDRSHGGLVAEFAVLPSARSAHTFAAPIGPPSGNGPGTAA
ncbi:MAG: hypothetical protein KGL16_00210 [Acidobacteriota bacterium]|nr:hypothetical protein [Acidobacteriota bacterium]